MLKPLQVSFIEEPGRWGGGAADKLTETKSCLTGPRCFSLPDLQEAVLDAEGQRDKKKSASASACLRRLDTADLWDARDVPLRKSIMYGLILPRENVLLFDLMHGMKTEALLSHTHGKEKLKGG